VLLCLLLRAAGFAAVAAAGGTLAVVPLMYLIPLAGIAFGAYATIRDVGFGTPRIFEAAWDAIAREWERIGRRFVPQPGAAEGQ
jgi:hypothetical protein